MTSSYWDIVLDQLLCPSGHIHFLETLKQANFLTLYPAVDITAVIVLPPSSWWSRRNRYCWNKH